MNVWFVVLCIFCFGIIGYSFFKYINLSLSFSHRLALISLRALFSLLLFIAITEPVMKFERLPKLTDRVPVLIDHSLSTRLFKPDSTILPLLDTLSSLKKTHPEQAPHFEFFLFGDSLRAWDMKTITFNDKKSNFPSFHQSIPLMKASKIIMLTDGNFTNPVRYSGYNEDKEFFYVKLPPARPVHSLQLSVNAPSSISEDSTVTIECLLTGFLSMRTDITVSCFTKNTFLNNKVIQADSGQVNEKISLSANSIPAGVHVLRTTVAINDSLVTQHQHTVKVLPGKLVYATRYSFPTMDNRFILLSASTNSSFVKSDNNNDSLDMILITRRPVDITHRLSFLKRTGVIVFAGCTPCSLSTAYLTKSLIVNTAQYSPLIKLHSIPLPPVTILHQQCGQSSYSDVFAGITIEGGSRDTLPLLYASTYAGHKALIFALQDYWKWDFVPLNTNEGEEYSFTITGSIIETAKELILQNIFNNYIAFPVNPTLNSDFLEFRQIIPVSSIGNRTASIHFSLRNDSYNLDTFFEKSSDYLSYMIPPAPAGNYLYQSQIMIDSQVLTYTDSVFVGNDNREYVVKNQNEILLSEIGQPLPRHDILSIQDIFDSDKRELRIPVKESVRFSRTWLLLAVTLSVFCTELLVRRKAGLI